MFRESGAALQSSLPVMKWRVHTLRASSVEFLFHAPIFRNSITKLDISINRIENLRPTTGGKWRLDQIVLQTLRLLRRSTKFLWSQRPSRAPCRKMDYMPETGPGNIEASPNGPLRNPPREKLTGRAFYQSLGSPKMILAPMVDQSEFVGTSILAMHHNVDYTC